MPPRAPSAPNKPRQTLSRCSRPVNCLKDIEPAFPLGSPEQAISQISAVVDFPPLAHHNGCGAARSRGLMFAKVFGVMSAALVALTSHIGSAKADVLQTMDISGTYDSIEFESGQFPFSGGTITFDLTTQTLVTGSVPSLGLSFGPPNNVFPCFSDTPYCGNVTAGGGTLPNLMGISLIGPGPFTGGEISGRVAYFAATFLGCEERPSDCANVVFGFYRRADTRRIYTNTELYCGIARDCHT